MFETGSTPSDLSPAVIQARMREIQQPPTAVLRARLAAARPMHLSRVATFVFLAATILTSLLVPAVLIAPLVSIDSAVILRDLDSSLPLPAPILVLLLALCFGVAWVTAGQAMLAAAYDCPLLPDEQKAYERLQQQLELYGGTAAFVSDAPDDGPPPIHMPGASLRAATPAPASGAALGQGGLPTPVPTPGGTLQYQSAPDPFLAFAGGASQGRSANRSGTPRPLSSATPRPAADRGAQLSYGGFNPDAPTDVPAEPSGDPRSGGYVVGPGLETDLSEDGAAATASWRAPRWGPIQDPWLLDAVRKAEDLARRYPVQAFLEYSVEPDLPFTLVLERATPAMAVRAMVEFVGFLASIATPKRARIELRSVVHLDRSFYRSVMSAMEPYFPDTVDIRQNGFRVEITFLEPERCWNRVPMLPIE